MISFKKSKADCITRMKTESIVGTSPKFKVSSGLIGHRIYISVLIIN
jgi:hypothetical protein